MRVRLPVALAPWLTVAAAWPTCAAPRAYQLDLAHSRILVQVGRAGLLSFAGHAHEVLVPLSAGRIVVDEQQPGNSQLEFEVATSELRVTGRGEPADDVPRVQAKMLGGEVLDASRYPRIVFRSQTVVARTVQAGTFEVRVVGELELHGQRAPLTLVGQVESSAGRLRAHGSTLLRQRDFGLKPPSVAGVVKVKDELSIEWNVEAHALDVAP